MLSWYLFFQQFFDKPFDQSCPWGPVFRFKNHPDYAHHGFCQFTSKYFGDLHASSFLFASYKKCLCNVHRSRCIAAKSSSIETQCRMPTFNNDEARIFRSKFFDLYVDICFLIASQTSRIIPCPSFKLPFSQITMNLTEKKSRHE